MIHSIYTRLVLAFIAVVLASTFITFTIVGTLYREEGWRYLQSDIRDTGKQVIELYSLREKINFDEFLQKLARLNNVRISLHSADGVVKSYQDPEVDAIEPLNPQMVESVLGGNEYSGKISWINLKYLRIQLWACLFSTRVNATLSLSNRFRVGNCVV